MKTATAAVLAAALIASPAKASASCGDPGQDPCTGPVPTVDQVVAIFAELTDPDRAAASKTDIVTPGFSPDEAGTIDDRLNRSRGPQLPLHFAVTNIQPAQQLRGSHPGHGGQPSPEHLGQADCAG
jgi:hypothetical protein